MYKLMDYGMCADKDLPTVNAALASMQVMIEDCGLNILPMEFTIVNEAGEVVETHNFSLNHEITKHG